MPHRLEEVPEQLLLHFRWQEKMEGQSGLLQNEEGGPGNHKDPRRDGSSLFTLVCLATRTGVSERSTKALLTFTEIPQQLVW